MITICFCDKQQDQRHATSFRFRFGGQTEINIGQFYIYIYIYTHKKSILAAGRCVSNQTMSSAGPHTHEADKQASTGKSFEPSRHVAPLRWVFKDYSNWHSDLRRHKNRFLELTSAWKPVFMPIGIIFKIPPLGYYSSTQELIRQRQNCVYVWRTMLKWNRWEGSRMHKCDKFIMIIKLIKAGGSNANIVPVSLGSL